MLIMFGIVTPLYQDDPVDKHLMTIQQFEQGLIDILGVDDDYEKPVEGDLEGEVYPENPEDIQRQIDTLSATNQMLEDELVLERGHKADLQAKVAELSSEIKDKDETIANLKIHKLEKDELIGKLN